MSATAEKIDRMYSYSKRNYFYREKCVISSIFIEIKYSRKLKKILSLFNNKYLVINIRSIIRINHLF